MCGANGTRTPSRLQPAERRFVPRAIGAPRTMAEPLCESSSSFLVTDAAERHHERNRVTPLAAGPAGPTARRRGDEHAATALAAMCRLVATLNQPAALGVQVIALFS